MSTYAGRHRGRHAAPQGRGLRRLTGGPATAVVGRGLTKSAAVLGVAGVGVTLVSGQTGTSTPSSATALADGTGAGLAAFDVAAPGAVAAGNGILVKGAPGVAGERASRSAARVTAPSPQGPVDTTLGALSFRAVAKPAAATGGTAATPRVFPVNGTGLGGLTANAQRVLAGVLSTFGQITSVIGVRPDAIPDHPSGRAIDFMLPSWSSASGIDLGNQVVAYVQAHAAEWNVDYIIFRQRIWFPGSGWRAMADRGSPTANHMDHVHVSVKS